MASLGCQWEGGMQKGRAAQSHFPFNHSAGKLLFIPLFEINDLAKPAELLCTITCTHLRRSRGHPSVQHQQCPQPAPGLGLAQKTGGSLALRPQKVHSHIRDLICFFPHLHFITCHLFLGLLPLFKNLFRPCLNIPSALLAGIAEPWPGTRCIFRDIPSGQVP